MRMSTRSQLQFVFELSVLTLAAWPNQCGVGVAAVCAADTPPNEKPVPAAANYWAEIRVIDAGTDRGVPLAELETVNALKFVTDNAGRVAFQEPGLMGRELFFTVRSHGYEMPKDGFGFAGARITPRAGQSTIIKLPRRNLGRKLRESSW